MHSKLATIYGINLCTLFFLVGSTSVPSYAQSSDSALAEIVRQTRAVDPSAKLSASISGDEVLISTESSPKANDDTCKVQAILIAKAMFDSQPEAIQKTKLVLFDYAENKCRSIVIKRAEIKIYAENGMSQKALLSSIDFEVTFAASAPSSDQSALKVVDGPSQTERLLLLGRINRMKQAGTNTSAFMMIFKDLEAAATANDQTLVTTKLEYLGDKVSEQEQTIKQVKANESDRSKSPRSNSARLSQEDARSAAALASLAHDGLSSAQQALVEIATRQVQLMNKITAFSVVNPGFVGNDLEKLNGIGQLVKQNNLSGANQVLSSLEAKYAAARF